MTNEKAFGMFIQIIFLQIFLFSFLSLLNIGITTNITYSFPALDKISIVNLLITSWNVIKFLVVNIYFSFLNYDNLIIKIINLVFTVIIWIITFDLAIGYYEKIKL